MERCENLLTASVLKKKEARFSSHEFKMSGGIFLLPYLSVLVTTHNKGNTQASMGERAMESRVQGRVWI